MTWFLSFLKLRVGFQFFLTIKSVLHLSYLEELQYKDSFLLFSERHIITLPSNYCWATCTLIIHEMQIQHLLVVLDRANASTGLHVKGLIR